MNENFNIDIAAILADKPLGTKLWSDTFGEVTFEKVTHKRPYCLQIRSYEGSLIEITRTGHYFDDAKGCAPCIVPSKEMRDWKKFAWKKGDVLKAGVGNLCIFDSWESDNYTEFHAKFATPNYSGALLKTKEWNNIEETKGGKLNLETLEIEKKQIVDLPKEEKKCEFQPFDKVLVRNLDEDEWKPDFFSKYYSVEEEFGCISGMLWKQCIPYEGNEKMTFTDSPF